MQNQFLKRSYIFVLFLFSLNMGCGKSDSPDPNPPQPTPGITGFSPLAAAAGEQVTITGSNFSTNTATNNVKFNGTTATVSTATTTQLIATVPAGVTNGKISVTVNNQTATSSADFNILAMVSTLAGSGVSGFADGSGIAAQFGHV